MASSLPARCETPRKVNKSPDTPSPPNSLNSLSTHINRLSLNTAAVRSLPASSPTQASPARSPLFQSLHMSPPDGSQSSRTFHRSPSSLSTYDRAHSPSTIMNRSSSSMSMHGSSPASSLRKKASMGSFNSATPPRARRASPSPATIARSPLATADDVTVYTPSGIAETHFASELKVHSDATAKRPASTIIILHDSCYGHRYSRPRTSKATLASMVERPERIQASVLGVSLAYVRLGGRYAEGCFPPHPKKEGSSLPNIPFKIHKTDRKLPLSSPAVINVHGAKWLDELKIMCNSADTKLATSGKELARESSKNTDGLPGPLHEGDLYLCGESLNAMEGALGAVCEGVDAVFQGSDDSPSRAFVIVRPPGHHCSSNYPSGFCWLNNVHVGIQHAILNHGLTHTAIIDFDLHHGDGSQSIAWDHNKRASAAVKNAAAWKKTSIGYFSLHDINSYPCEMGDDEKVTNASICIQNAHGQNIWNIHLQPWKTEEEFWDIYKAKYSVLLEKARKFLRTQTKMRSSVNSAPPKAAIFFSAGFDASEWESDGMQRHKVNVPTEFYARLSRDVVKLAAEEGLGVDGRIVSVLEGGYSDRALMTGVLSHISGLAGGDPIVKDETGPGHDMSRGSSSVDGKTSAEGFQLDSTPYDADWWSRARLEQLDLLLHPLRAREPFQPTKLQALGNFSSPTQSFIAKVVPHRKVSYGPSVTIEAAPKVRPPSPIPPDVDWAVATHELSKLLIPSDRQTMSCKPEELSAAATKDRTKDRRSNLAENAEDVPQPMGPPVQPTRMSLRERKAPKSYVDDEDEPPARPASKVGGRKTVAGAASLATAEEPTNTAPAHSEFRKLLKPSSRRKSLLSNVSSASVASSTVPAVQLNGRPRPGTAQSIRPESSMSMRGSSIETKRQTRPETTKSSRAPSRAPARVPSRAQKPLTDDGSMSNRDGGHGITPARSKPSSLPGDAGKPPRTEDPVMDNITSRMGNVRLTLVTNAQREANAQAAKTATKAPRKPAALKATKAHSVKQKSSMSLPATPTKIKELPPTPAETPVQSEPGLPITELAQPNEAPDTQIPAQPIIILPAQQAAQPLQALHHEGTVPDRISQPENMTESARDTNSRAPIKIIKNHELPVFSSLGPIPFGGPVEQVTKDSDTHMIMNEKCEQTEQAPTQHSGNPVLKVPETPE